MWEDIEHRSEERVPMQDAEGSYSLGGRYLQMPTTHALALPTRPHCSVSVAPKVLPQLETSIQNMSLWGKLRFKQ